MASIWRSVSNSVLRPAALAGLALGWSALPAPAQEPPLGARIEAAVRPLGPYAAVAVRVVSLSRGDVLYERNPDLSLNPASNMKLVTSAAALAKLGADYRYTTRVLARGRQGGPVLAGDLVLQGGGDPVLETPHLEKLADAVRASGIRKVTGGLWVDDFRYDAERLGNGWNSDDEPYYYSAQISALSVNRNVATVDVFPGKAPGHPVTLRLKPLESYLRVVARPATAPPGARTAIEVTRVRARNEIRVTGTLAAGAAPVLNEEVTMEEPALFAGALFRKLLADRGVRVIGTTQRKPAPISGAVRQLAAHQSPPLAEILPLLNKPSDNLIAEMLLKELGCTVRQPGAASTGSDVVEGWLKELGIDVGGVRVNDGSGLSRLDLLTARALSDLLVKADAQPWKEPFIASLPVAGVDGTLRSRLKGTPAEKNLRAKTGSLLHVTSLSGYLTTAGGERLVVSILIHHPGSNSGPQGAKRIEDAIAALLARLEARPLAE